MKKGWKIFWIFIAIIVALGIICGCISLALGVTIADLDGDFYGLRKSMIVTEERIEEIGITAESTEVYEFDNITDLDISVGACEVIIKASNTDSVQVDVSRMRYGVLGLELSVKEENGTLTIQTTENGTVWDVLSARNDNGGLLKIYVPENLELSAADLEFGACDVEMSGLRINTMNLMLGAAECEMSQMNVNSLQAEVGAGDYDYSGTISGNVNIDCGAGDVELNLSGARDDFNYKLSAGMGEIEIGEREYGGLAVEETINNHAEKEMVIDCGAGSVSVDFR